MHRPTVSLLCAMLCIVIALLSLLGCGTVDEEAPRAVRLVIEEGEGFHTPQAVWDLTAGEDVSTVLYPDEGYEITGCDYEGAVTAPQADGSVLMILPGVRYTRTVQIQTQRNPYTIRYHLDAQASSDGSEEKVLTQTYPASHLRINTAAGYVAGFSVGSTTGSAADYTAGSSAGSASGSTADYTAGSSAGSASDLPGSTAEASQNDRRVAVLSADGSHLLCGWKTEHDGEGKLISLGSRIEVTESEPLDLYADWRPFSDASLFDYALTPTGEAVITGYHGGEQDLVLPALLDGHIVTSIGEGAFSGASCESVVLPPTLREVGLYAFENASLSTLTFYDTLANITDYAFSGCSNLETIRIQALQLPVYSGTYYDTFSDKMDRMRLLRDNKKILLFSGSSTRFGYDSVRIGTAFPEYDVVNLGVFAYTNALPQLDLVLLFAGQGDILVHTPEFDAAARQFCCTNAMDSAFFRMIESDYDLLSLLDYRDYGGLLSAYTTFQKERAGMDAGDYRLSASSFDEDHHPVSQPSYNAQGDYIVYRPNAEDDAPIYDLPVDYTVGSFSKSRYIDPINAVYQRFLHEGVRVYFDYAPRNREALSDQSTANARRELDEWFRASLCVPVLGEIEESLYPGKYLYGTDNHLSTEGVQVRTERFITDLQAQLEKGGRR